MGALGLCVLLLAALSVDFGERINNNRARGEILLQ
jgi:hypothetical protein